MKKLLEAYRRDVHRAMMGKPTKPNKSYILVYMYLNAISNKCFTDAEAKELRQMKKRNPEKFTRIQLMLLDFEIEMCEN